MINGNCTQCGEQAFLLDTTIECSNNECKHFDAELVCALLGEPQFNLDKMKIVSKDPPAGFFWFANVMKKDIVTNNKDKILYAFNFKLGPPCANLRWSSVAMIKVGVIGVYAKDGQSVKVNKLISPDGMSVTEFENLF